ncbi:MAG: aldo/keto reductase [Treponema sp.]|uniref:aldo/keto reductase n=1 Tax=Treponema sp. TaxID=166 RepID=UPI001B153513|nr:aldo/keto reductase [Treponema sp.]MBO6218461.1 aldo/keto reductase [Treponema sp.]MBQ8679262.1 aldo/keto reductase [Treponema sp.]
MDYIALGKSNLLVSRSAFGAQRIGDIEDPELAHQMVRMAYEDGVNFFDTSTRAPESERRLGAALSDVRENVFIATKSSPRNGGELAIDVDVSLRNLGTGYIDLYQLENPENLPKINDGTEIIEKLVELKSSGLIRHFGIVTDSMDLAERVLYSDAGWETIQFPFNMLCPESVENLTRRFYEKDIGFIAMQPLCGGVLTNLPLALGYFLPFENVVPLWGARNPDELQQILYFTKNPPRLDEQFYEEAEKIRAFFN